MITVRDAVTEDAGRISEIYDYHVKNTAITFEYNMPCLEEFLTRREQEIPHFYKRALKK